jgi:hypothetical protein
MTRLTLTEYVRDSMKQVADYLAIWENQGEGRQELVNMREAGRVVDEATDLRKATWALLETDYLATEVADPE